MTKFEWTAEEVREMFENATGEKASDYPTAKTIDFWVWTKEAHEEARRQSATN